MLNLLGGHPAGKAALGVVLVAVGVTKPAVALVVIGALALVWAAVESVARARG